MTLRFLCVEFKICSKNAGKMEKYDIAEVLNFSLVHLYYLYIRGMSNYQSET